MYLGSQPSYYPLLSELLTLPIFRGSRVLAGRPGLDKSVTGVNLSDTPDYFRWLQGGELMVTTCYAIHNDPAALDSFVPTLVKAGLSGLCLKPGRYLGAMPQSMVSLAEELCLPLIVLPEEVRFSDITKAVSDELLKRQTALLRSTISVNEMLTRTIVEGATLHEISGMISALTGSSVLILDSVNGRRALFLTVADTARFLGRPADEITSHFIAEAQKHSLEVGGHSFGSLYTYAKGSAEIEQDEAIMSQILQTIPLEISRERTVRASGDQHLNDFILHLLSDHIIDEQQERTRAGSFGLDLRQNHLIIRARVTDRRSEVNEYAGVFQRMLLSTEIKSILSHLGFGLRTVRASDEYLLLLSSSIAGNHFATVVERFPEIMEKLNAEYTSLSIAAGCGRPHADIAGLAQSDREARMALKIATIHGGSFHRFDDLGLLRLVYASDPEREIQSFIQESLGELIDPSQPRGTDLLLTLESYFRNFGNLKRISQELYTHYNTVVYRIKSIQEITGRDIHNPSERFQLELALRLYHFFELGSEHKDRRYPPGCPRPEDDSKVVG